MLFSDRLEVWNPGELPPPLTFESLHVPHPSIPRNPLLAEPLFLTRYIERAGTGTLDMAKLCTEAGLPKPEFRESAGQFIPVLWRPKTTGAQRAAGQARPESQLESQLESTLGARLKARILLGLRATSLSKLEISRLLAQKTVSGQLHVAIRELLEADWLEYTVPDKPNSRLQKYRLTLKGREWLVARKRPGRK